jgi:streptogramin lyase
MEIRKFAVGVAVAFTCSGMVVAQDDKQTTAAIPHVSEIGTNLGVQVRKATMMRGDVGRDKDGRLMIYTVLMGAPAVLSVVDVASGDVVVNYPLPDTSGAWSVTVATDGTVYLGAYNQGLVYRFDPKTEKLENLGHPFETKDTVLYPMAAGPGGKMYGGSYPSGHAYEYDPQKKAFRDLGDVTDVSAKERWIRVTVLDEEANKLYFGIGNEPQLVEYDLATGERRDLLPEKYKNITSVYDLNVEGGRLFCRKETHNPFEYFVLDQKTGEEITLTNADTGETTHVFINASRGLSPKSPVADKMYYAGLDRKMYEYDLKTNSFKALDVNMQGPITGYSWVELDEPGYPGYSLVGTVGNGGLMYKFNPETNKHVVQPVAYTGQAVNIHDIEAGPDGKIYTGGYLAGNMGVFDPATSQTTHLDGSGQTEGLVFVGHKLYMGVYPNAVIYEYDTQKPWNPGSVWKLDEPGEKNPNQVFTLQDNDSIPGYTNQDRPFGMAGAEDLQKLFVGTTPKNGMLGGALAVWDVSGGQEPEVYWNIVPDQSVVSLAYKDGMVYGGTSIYGGMGVTPKAKEGELFVWDVAKKEKVFSMVPAPGRTAVTQLHPGPDGNIWGLAGGVVFVFDPQKREVIHSKDEFPGTGGRYYEGSFLTGKDGKIYGTADRKLFRIDPETKVLTVLATGTQKVAQDKQGRLYTYGSPVTEMHQIELPELVGER